MHGSLCSDHNVEERDDMNLETKLIVLDTLTLYRSKKAYSYAADNSGSAAFFELSQSDGHTIKVTTNLLIEAWHGGWYGAGIGLLIGAYILFFPLWITVSPAWYTSAPWYVILAITTITSMLLFSSSAAVLGAHVLNSDLKKGLAIAKSEAALLMMPVHFRE